MTSSWHPRQAVPLVDRRPLRPYDCSDPYLDEGDLSLELPGPRSRYEQLAAQVRRDIYAGRYPPESDLPREVDLARDHGVSRALANRALQVLGDEELISQVQGRGTKVRPRRVYRVTVEVPFPEGPGRRSAAALRRAVGEAARSEPAVKAVESAELRAGSAVVSLLAEAADGDWAVRAAKLAVHAAAGTWSWEGWDLTLASYQCAPVRDE